MSEEQLAQLRAWKKEAMERHYCLSEWQISTVVLLEMHDKLQSQLAICKEALEWIMPKVHQAYHEGSLDECLKSTCEEFRKALEKLK